MYTKKLEVVQVNLTSSLIIYIYTCSVLLYLMISDATYSVRNLFIQITTSCSLSFFHLDEKCNESSRMYGNVHWNGMQI